MTSNDPTKLLADQWRQNSAAPLFEEHRKFLHNFQLNDETIANMQVYSVAADDLTPPPDNGAASAIIVPYCGHDYAIRVYVSGDLEFEFWQPPGTIAPLYVPRAVHSVLSDPRKALLWTESPLMAEYYTQRGMPAIAISFVNCLSPALRAEVDAIAHGSRLELLAPAADRGDIVMHLGLFQTHLEIRGAHTRLVVREDLLGFAMEEAVWSKDESVRGRLGGH